MLQTAVTLESASPTTSLLASQQPILAGWPDAIILSESNSERPGGLQGSGGTELNLKLSPSDSWCGTLCT